MNMAGTDEQEKRGPKPGPVRMCAGCAKRDAEHTLVRVVLDLSTAELAVDMAGGRFGRGGHVHPNKACVEKALKGGFAKVFKNKVEGTLASFGGLLVQAADRRIEGLISGARRAKHVTMGADAVVETIRNGEAKTIIVAADAAAAASLGAVQQMVDSGHAVVWQNKQVLGAIFDRNEVAVAAITNAGVAEAIEIAVRIAQPFRGEAWLEVSREDQ